MEVSLWLGVYLEGLSNSQKVKVNVIAVGHRTEKASPCIA
jgi:hypothetical protein